MSVVQFADKRAEKTIYDRWIAFYTELSYETCMEHLINEHEHNFPLRSSSHAVDRMKHKALVQVCDDKAQSHFLRAFLDLVKDGGVK